MFFRLLLLAASFSAFANDPEKVHFRNKGDSISGELYWPKTRPPKGGFPAVVLIGPASSVKNQIVDRYAARLSKNGFVALTFDPRTFGESGGWPRQMESPEGKVTGFIAAVEFLKDQKGIDKKHISAVGICCGANVALHASIRSRWIQSLAFVSSCPVNRDYWRTSYGERLTQLKVDGAKAALAEFQLFKRVKFIKATASVGDRLISSALVDENAADYFLTARNPASQWENRIALMSMLDFLNFDSVSAIPQLDKPTIFVLASNEEKIAP